MLEVSRRPTTADPTKGVHEVDWNNANATEVYDLDGIVTYCPACGEATDFCQGHGEIGDPEGHRILTDHDSGRHPQCNPWACTESSIRTKAWVLALKGHVDNLLHGRDTEGVTYYDGWDLDRIVAYATEQANADWSWYVDSVDVAEQPRPIL